MDSELVLQARRQAVVFMAQAAGYAGWHHYAGCDKSAAIFPLVFKAMLDFCTMIEVILSRHHTYY